MPRPAALAAPVLALAALAAGCHHVPESAGPARKSEAHRTVEPPAAPADKAQAAQTTTPAPPTTSPAAPAPAPASSAGAPRGAFAGTAACESCHEDEYGEWTKSEHGRDIVAATPETQDSVASMIQCSDMSFTRVLGDRHEERFLTERPASPWGQGRWLVLPCGWDIDTKDVKLHHPEDWEHLPWENSCAACHTTDFRASDHGFSEMGVGCERCHGAGARHALSQSAADITSTEDRPAREEVTLCASCHLQGGKSKTTGLQFPNDYHPGGALFPDYEFDWASLDKQDASKALDVHQKLIIRRVVRDGDDSLRCTSCHQVHQMRHEKHAKLPQQPFCFTCHQPDMKLKEYQVSCNVCEF